MLRYAYLFLDGNPLEGRALVGIDEIDSISIHAGKERCCPNW